MSGFGVETACTTGYKAGRLVSGWRVVAQALYRRLTTPAGSLREDPSYGVDLSELVGSFSAGEIGGIVAAQFKKDDRVASVDVKAFETASTDGTITVSIQALVVLEDEGGAFTLTASATTDNVSELFAQAA